jgi:hypothetical protein
MLSYYFLYFFWKEIVFILIDLGNCKLGIAFYIGAAGALTYLVIIIFYRYTKGRFTRANLFEILLK